MGPIRVATPFHVFDAYLVSFATWEALDPRAQGCTVHVPSMSRGHMKGKKVHVNAFKCPFNR